MSDLLVHHRLEKCLQTTLQERVPGLKWHAAHEKPEGDPPYGCVQCDEARETTPESGVYYVRTAILVTHVLDEVDGVTHSRAVQETRVALEQIPRPAEDDDWGVRIYGYTIDKQTMADDEQEVGTLLELNVGCGVMEKQEGGPVNTAKVP